MAKDAVGDAHKGIELSVVFVGLHDVEGLLGVVVDMVIL